MSRATWAALLEHHKLIRAAGWKTPPGHADLDPPHEALQLVEHYREAARLQKDRPEEFRRWLKTAEDEAADLERVLRGTTTTHHSTTHHSPMDSIA